MGLLRGHGWQYDKHRKNQKLRKLRRMKSASTQQKQVAAGELNW